jgi:dienelactone hydrolase
MRANAAFWLAAILASFAPGQVRTTDSNRPNQSSVGITCSTSNISAGWAGATRIICTVTAPAELDQDVALACGGAPEGTKCTINPAVVYPKPGADMPAALEVSYTEGASFGRFPLQVVATAGQASARAEVIFQRDANTVSSRCPSPDEIAQIDRDLRLRFDSDPSKGTRDCAAAEGSAGGPSPSAPNPPAPTSGSVPAQAAANSDRPEPLVCKPAGQGPFPTVIWNHGRVDDPQTFAAAQRGWKNLCEAFAADGYLGYMPIRPFAANLGPADIAREAGDLARVLDRVMAMGDVDRAHVALMGHSRGATLALMVAARRSDLAAVILTAPAPIPSRFLGDTFARVRSMRAPVLLMVENSDELGSLAPVREIDEQLAKRKGDDHRTIRYDRGGGHFLFVRKDYWWSDFKGFLDDKLKRP